MRAPRNILILGMLSGAMADCAHTPPAPLPAEQVLARNRRYDKSPLQEKRHGLPDGTLASESSIVVMDANRVCFDTVLRVLSQRQDHAELKNWRIVLSGGEPEFNLENPEIYPAGGPEFEKFTGYRRTYDTVGGGVCSGSGRCWSGGLTYPTGWVQETDTTVALSGTICFPNRGEINQSTENLKLSIEDPRVSFLSRQYATFRWDLENGSIK